MKTGKSAVEQALHYSRRAPKLGRLLSFVKKHYSTRLARKAHSRTHGLDHVFPVALLAVELASKSGAKQEEQEMAFAAGLMHDCKRVPEAKVKGIDEHELQGAIFAGKILPSLGFSKKETRTISRAIETHSFSSTPKGSKKVAYARGTVANAVKAADKSEQFFKAIIWRRSVFLGESLEKFDVGEIVAYYKKRLKECRAFLRTAAGKMVLKAFPKVKQDLAWIAKYAKKLGEEKKSLEKYPKLGKDFEILGATGHLKTGFAIGRRHGAKEEARGKWAERLAKYRKEWKKRNANATPAERRVLIGGLRFSLEIAKTLWT